MSSSLWRESSQDLRIVLSAQGDALSVTLWHLGEASPLADATIPAPDFASLKTTLRSLRQGLDLSASAQEAFGEALAGFLLPPPIRKVLLPLRHQGAIRLRVQAEAPWSGLPWELAYLEGGFLSHQSDLCLVREAEPAGSAPSSEEEEGPSRRVLLAWANPNSGEYPELPALEAETKSVGKALSAPECRSLKVDTLPFATLSAFVRTLQRQSVDIVNFIGHGDQRQSGGVIILEGSRPGEHEEVSAEDLLPALRAARVRLVVLSSCLTATADRGMAARLVEGGIPAVVAMQFPWDDQTARLFSRAFYGALAEGSAIEDAVFQGRSAIRGCGAHWAVPVLTLSSRPSLRPAAPPIKVQTNNLPTEDWPFVGRTAELKSLQKAVKDGRRLITITGSGGMGKTRLARQFARQMLSKYPDGVWQVDCEPLASEDDLREALAVVPGLEGANQTWASIGEAIGDRRMLLVLDCFERLAGCARVLAPLISANPNLQLLVTSRRLLGLPREHEMAIQPLSLTKRRGKADGTELFQTAASYADPDIGKSEEDRALIEALVRDLEAVPLAIVLAAGRLRYLSLAELRTRLESNLFEALQGEDADYSQVIQASFDLLGPADLDLAERLSVFHGGFSYADVEAVLGGERDLDQRIRVLRDHSILIAQNAGDRKRFRILDAVREHVGRREGSEAKMEEIRRRHAEHFAVRAAEIREASNAGNWQRANRELGYDAANFRAAIRYATATRAKDLIRSFARSLARMYLEAGARSDFDLVTIPANQHAEADGDTRLRMELAGLEGALHRREKKDLARARDVWLIRARLAQDLGDFDAMADSLLDVADLALERGQLDSVEALLLRVEGIRDQIASAPLRASASLLNAKLALRLGQPERALALARDSYTPIQDIEGDPMAMYVWISLAQVFLAVGSLPDSERTCRRMILESIRCGYIHYMGRALLALSAIREAAGRTEDAALATAIAMRIPPSASRSLRSEAVQRSRALAERYGARLIKTASERAKVAAESELAMSLVEDDFHEIR